MICSIKSSGVSTDSYPDDCHSGGKSWLWRTKQTRKGWTKVKAQVTWRKRSRMFSSRLVKLKRNRIQQYRHTVTDLHCSWLTSLACNMLVLTIVFIMRGRVIRDWGGRWADVQNILMQTSGIMMSAFSRSPNFIEFLLPNHMLSFTGAQQNF